MSGEEDDWSAGRLVASFVHSIEEAYDDLGHELGWRFLYSPSSTLSASSQLIFAGLNPGGGSYEPPVPTVEAGNAYRAEPWGPHGSLNRLQTQICAFYAAVATELGKPDAVQLMDETLAVNFCPFRSASWETLVRRKESVAFSRDLWARILEVARPKVVVCLGDLAARHIGEAIIGAGGRPAGPASRLPVGWGAVSYGTTEYDTAADPMKMVRLPHLSRFGFFGRPASSDAVKQLAGTVARALS